VTLAIPNIAIATPAILPKMTEDRLPSIETQSFQFLKMNTIVTATRKIAPGKP
jgi:hypothetical protein